VTDALAQAYRQALKHNLDIKPSESVLIVSDEIKKEIGLAFKKAAVHFSKKVEFLEIPDHKFNGQEPPDFAAQKCKMRMSFSCRLPSRYLGPKHE